VEIGNKKNDQPTDLVGVLLECHDRIRRFIGVVGRLAEAETEDSSEIAEAAGAVRRYFSEALPLHIQDEELTLTPRLTGRDMVLDTALRAMREQHEFHDSLVEDVVRVSTALAEQPTRIEELRDELETIAGRLARELTAHLHQEEAIIFPAIKTLLTSDEQDSMLAELRARRSD